MRKASWLNSKTILVKDVKIVAIHSYLRTQSVYVGMGWSESSASQYDLSFHDNNLVDMLVGENNVLFIVREKTKDLIDEVKEINSKND